MRVPALDPLMSKQCPTGSSTPRGKNIYLFNPLCSLLGSDTPLHKQVTTGQGAILG